MNQPYRTVVCALATVVWLSLNSCARNSTATQSPNTQSDNLSVSRTNSSPSTTREADSKTFIAQNTGNSRSPDQKMQRYQQTIPIVTTADLPEFDMPIFKPTYLPVGFFLREFQALEHYYDLIDDPNPFVYSITYQKRDTYTCLEIYSSLDGTSFEDLGLSETSVKMSHGEVTVYSGNVEGRPMIVALVPVDVDGTLLDVDVEQLGLLSSGKFFLFTIISGYSDWCEPVSMEEFIQVLQSMKLLN
jgi:hypothetical protein